MGTTPLFSVLIANYNCGRFLQEAINSVLEQNYPNIEIVIVDDFSSDESDKIYTIYKDNPRFTILYNDRNYGVGYTKNKLIEVARGDICGFLDADDVLCPNAIKNMVDAHNNNPECSTILSRHYNCNEKLEILSESRLLYTPKGFDYFKHQDYQVESFVSFRRDLYLQSQGLSPVAKSGEDQQLIYLLEEIAPCTSINVFTYKYRLRNDSVSHGMGTETLFWNSILQYETCLRRGLPVEKYAYNIFKNTYEKYLDLARNNWKNVLLSICLKPFIRLKKALMS